MSSRWWIGCLAGILLLPGLVSLSEPLSAQPDGGSPPSVSASPSTVRRHVRLLNGSLLTFEQLDAWRSAAVCLRLAVPMQGREDEKAILTHLAAGVLSSLCEAGLPAMVAERGSVEEGFRCEERAQAILLAIEVSPAALDKACELLASAADFDPPPEELAWYIGGRKPGRGDVRAGTEVIELLRVLASRGTPRPPPDRPAGLAPDGEQLRDFLNTLRQPANVTVSVCAPSVSEATVSSLARLFSARPIGSIESGHSDAHSSPERGAVSMEQRVLRFPRAGPLVGMCLGFSLPCNSREEYWATRALVAALGGPRLSRLYQALRRRGGLAYALDSRVELCRGEASAVVECLVPREVSAGAEGLLLREASRLAGGGVSDEEFRRSREYLKGLAVGLWQQPLGAAMQNAEEAAAFQRQFDMPPWEVIDSLTKDEIDSAVRRIAGNWFLCVYG